MDKTDIEYRDFTVSGVFPPKGKALIYPVPAKQLALEPIQTCRCWLRIRKRFKR